MIFLIKYVLGWPPLNKVFYVLTKKKFRSSDLVWSSIIIQKFKDLKSLKIKICCEIIILSIRLVKFK